MKLRICKINIKYFNFILIVRSIHYTIILTMILFFSLIREGSYSDKGPVYLTSMPLDRRIFIEIAY